MPLTAESEVIRINNAQPLFADLEHYDYVADAQGNYIAVDKSTGEALETVQTCSPVGTSSYTPASKQEYKEEQEQAHKRYLSRVANKGLGNFYFIFGDEQFKGLSPESVTRLIYLNTFAARDDNHLILSERGQPMLRKDLTKVLQVSPATACRFWKEVNPYYIDESPDGLIINNDNIFFRGSIKDRRDNDYYRKIYINGVRTLYRSTDTSNHRHLGYIFRLLPFINYEYNIICHNPDEQDLDYIVPLTISEFCNAIGYDINNISRLKSIYRDIRFAVGDKHERVCAFVYDGINNEKTKIIINPHIIYNGSDYNKVEVLGAFYKD